MKRKLRPPSNPKPMPNPFVSKRAAQGGISVQPQRRATPSVVADGVAEGDEVEAVVVENKPLPKLSLRRRSRELLLTFQVLRVEWRRVPLKEQHLR
jgi:hypothetical protein